MKAPRSLALFRIVPVALLVGSIVVIVVPYLGRWAWRVAFTVTTAPGHYYRLTDLSYWKQSWGMSADLVGPDLEGSYLAYTTEGILRLALLIAALGVGWLIRMKPTPIHLLLAIAMFVISWTECLFFEITGGYLIALVCAVPLTGCLRPKLDH